MKLKNKLQRDPSGVSSLLVIAVIAVLIVAAAAAYVVLSDKGNNNQVLRGPDWAPGTSLDYDIKVDGAKVGVANEVLVGQNADEYFIKTETTFSSGPTAGVTSTTYALSSKNVEDAERIGTEEIDTMDGRKMLEVWQYAVGSETAKVYGDPANGLIYRYETALSKEVAGVAPAGSTMVMDLTKYTLLSQESYVESESIGKTYVYAYTVVGLALRGEVVCVADCLNGQYGILLDSVGINGESDISYFLSDYKEGLPKDAVKADGNASLETIDGTKTVDMWKLSGADKETVFYVDPISNIIYGFDVIADSPEGKVTMQFKLVEKPL
ncbi:MAG: hypothetical protein LBR42_01565 [Candidatus Methanoplasma sp.]|jgi:hypothetical protein|nr:hypothetical protein [Candidatus Methanoplasma sp.]